LDKPSKGEAVSALLVAAGIIVLITVFLNPNAWGMLAVLSSSQSPTVEGNVAYGAGGYSWSISNSVPSLTPPAYYTTQSNYAGQSSYMMVTGFKFQVPSTATVTGVALIIQKSGGTIYSTYSCTNTLSTSGSVTQGCVGSSGTGAPNGFQFTPQGSSYSSTTTPISDASVRLFYLGVPVGQDRAVDGGPWSTTPTNSIYGGDSVTWQISSLTPAMIDDPSFGFGIAVNYNPYPNPVASTSTQTQATVYHWLVWEETVYYYQNPPNPNWNTGTENGHWINVDDMQNTSPCTDGTLTQGTPPPPPYYSGESYNVYVCNTPGAGLQSTATGTQYNYAYNTNAVYGSINSMSMIVYYNWPYPTVTETSGIPTTVTVTPATSIVDTTQTNSITITQSGSTTTTKYTITLGGVTASDTITSTTTVPLTNTLTSTQTTSTATALSSIATTPSGLQLTGLGPIVNLGQVAGLIIGSVGIGGGALYYRKVVS
jgi:hypothetical protein